MRTQVLKPGEQIRVSGQYVQVGPRGGKSKNEVTLVSGKTTPPTSKQNCTYSLVDKTKHKH